MHCTRSSFCCVLLWLQHLCVAYDAGTSVARFLEVKLSHNQIGGSIPSFIAQLPTLLLDLSYNQLTGSLPAAFSSNGVLRELYLSNNGLSGTLSSALLR